MICKLEIYNGELNLFPVVTNERVFAQITMGNIVKGQPGKSPIIGENDNWWVYNNETGEYEDTGKIATTSDDVVKYVEAKDEQHPNRKAIQLANGDLITGVAKKEGLGSVNIAMVNEWDVVDLGTSELPINLNTPKGVRPTVQEAGQTGGEANKIAYLSDLENVGGEISVISLYRHFNSGAMIDLYYVSKAQNTKLWDCIDNNKKFVFEADSILLIPTKMTKSDQNHVNIWINYTKVSDDDTGLKEVNLCPSINFGTLVRDYDYDQMFGSSEIPNPEFRLDLIKNGEGTKFLADDGQYKEIPTGGDVEVIKLSEWFNGSPSVLIEQTEIFPEENAKLFKALEDNKTIILALYKGSNHSSPYESLKTVYGKLSINRISDTKIEIIVENLTAWENRIYVGSLKLGPFYKNKTDSYIVNFNSGIETTSITLDKSGDGTKFLGNNGNYLQIPGTSVVYEHSTLSTQRITVDLYNEIKNNLVNGFPMYVKNYGFMDVQRNYNDSKMYIRYSKMEFVEGSSAIEDPVVNNVILTLNKSQDQNGVYYNNVVTEFNTQTIHQLMDRITALEAKTSNL